MSLSPVRDPQVEEDAQLLISLLSQTAIALSSQVSALLPKLENFLGVSVAIMVGGITLGVTQKHPVILVVLPFPILVLFVYLLQANTELLSRAGHKCFLEEKVNELTRRGLLLEESHVAPMSLHGRATRLGRLSIVLIQLLMATLLAGSTALGIAHLRVLHPGVWHAVFWTGLVVGAVMLTAAVREQSRAYRLAYEAARAGFSGAPSPSKLLGDVDRRRFDGRAEHGW